MLYTKILQIMFSYILDKFYLQKFSTRAFISDDFIKAFGRVLKTILNFGFRLLCYVRGFIVWEIIKISGRFCKLLNNLSFDLV